MRGLPVHVNTVIWKKELKKGRNKQRRRRRRRKEQESAEAISGLKNWVLLDFSSDFWLFWSNKHPQTFWAKLSEIWRSDMFWLLGNSTVFFSFFERIFNWNLGMSRDENSWVSDHREQGDVKKKGGDRMY